MGYHGKSITASDKSSEMTDTFYSFFSIERYDDNNGSKTELEVLGKDVIQERLDELLIFVVNMKIDTEDALTLCYHLVLRGVKLTDEQIDKFIGCFSEDQWSDTCLERKIYMNLAIADLQRYKLDNTPIDIDYYYDFENCYSPICKDNKLSVEKIIKLVEDNSDIKVLSSVRSRYSIYFVVSSSDFEKVQDGFCGINFLMNI